MPLPSIPFRRTGAGLATVVVLAGAAAVPARGLPVSGPMADATSTAGATANSLETAANKAGATGRSVAMSLIGLGFAVAAIVLSFRRDFKEAAGVFAVGLVAILLATPAGVSLLQDTVNTLFGSQ